MSLPHWEQFEKLGGQFFILGSVAERARFEPGCNSFLVYQGVEDKHVIYLEQFRKNNEDMERHLRSTEFRKGLLLVEMALESPEIRFHPISNSTGGETIERARTLEEGKGRV